ncbi:peptidoglycan DD-metalloendopeptidase family protein [Thermotoga neapolitana]|uniref:Peptidase M23 n=1 Tax=Thermotoga neapolitana (strain ATCC 49049 / DSM 4359 / NBRC 107923 / NS-E) TaxID=309803 RepID=B9KB77_THENN|nr:peptidoglycan DD-metalloendopeptidase family protein [Thermotoga neapolitana]ACM22273.1 Peptidase M23 precursor [Thermotoga neapolitana DSM 4359]HBF11743.1 LysM peptidoglycan-binding domain-containing protein [Thermotoga neapolitana]
MAGLKKIVIFLLVLVLLGACVPSEWREKLDRVEEQIRQINAHMDLLEKKIDDLQKRVNSQDASQEEMESLKREMEYLKKDLSSLQEEFRTRLDEIEGSYYTISMKLPAVEKAVSVLSDLEDLKTKVSELERKMSIATLGSSPSPSEDLKHILLDLEERVSRLERNSSRVDEMEKRLESSEKLLSKVALRVLSQNEARETVVYTTNDEIESRIEQIENRLSQLENNQKNLEQVVQEMKNIDTSQFVNVNPASYTEQLRKYLDEFRRLVRSYEIARILGIEEGYVFVRVERGDTLAKISDAFNLGPDGVEKIMKLNGIEDPRKLIAGQIIKVPVTNLSASFPVGEKPDPKIVVAGFGLKSDGSFSSGVVLESSGQKVKAALPGRVKSVKDGTVVVYHGNDVETVYRNLSVVRVNVGDWVGAGETIGYGGSNVEFELYVEGEPKDPMLLFFSNMGEFEISFYTEWEDGKLPEHPAFRLTKSGKIPKEWQTAAADTSVFPIGSVLYIPELRDAPNGGVFVVEDIGGVIKGRKIDIYLDSIREALHNRKIVSRVFVWRD